MSFSEMSLGKYLNVSCGASVLMLFWIFSSMYNLARLMYPLSYINISDYDDNLVNPLWTSGPQDEMHLRVYLSTEPTFQTSFFDAEFWSNDEESNSSKGGSYQPARPTNAALLWEEEVSSAAFSKSFLLTRVDCSNDNDNHNNNDISSSNNDCSNQEAASYNFAKAWLDKADQVALERGEGGVIAAMSAAGQGIESTSVLLSLYQSLSKQIRKLFVSLKLVSGNLSDDKFEEEERKRDLARILDRKTVLLPADSDIWKSITSNATVHAHVLVIRRWKHSQWPWPPRTIREAMKGVQMASRSNSLLTGGVCLVKYDLPHHIGQPRRILFNDILYFWNKYVKHSREMPPWVMEFTKPEETMNYKTMQQMKANKQPYPYWKPEVSIKYVNEVQSYPYELAGMSGMPLVRVHPSQEHPTGIALIPGIHVDEIGLTQNKYIPLNQTVTSLPLRISFDRSDLEQHQTTTTTRVSSSTVNAGGMSPARWRLMRHMSEALERQRDIGFEPSDIDEVRNLIADTNVTLLLITMLASALHLLFEFLTFKNEVTFWNNNKDLTGLSVRSLFMDFFGQTVILMFLIEKESSLLITVPAAIGCLIALWKCRKAAGLEFVQVVDHSRKVEWYNWIPRFVFGYELRATRLELSKEQWQQITNDNGTTTATTTTKNHKSKDGKAATSVSKKLDLTAVTIESDRLATRTIGVALLPLVISYTVYSLLYEEHKGWISWMVTSASSGVYAFGFVMMTPQLFLNWKLKSVAHLPWRVLCYKFLNTFIDDLFSFIVRMPTMARLSCFRDDVIFFIYLYQRWLYPVDTSRPAEGFGESPDQKEEVAATAAAAASTKSQKEKTTAVKKNQ